jgi:cobalt-precorrin 5A hydrolase/precorrin-3B C17-methyltransferase
LARVAARILGGQAAVTTAGDGVLGVSLDEPPQGWKIADPVRIKPVAAALLAGRPMAVAGDAPWLAGLPQGDDGVAVSVTHRVPDTDGLVYHPPRLALGVGCERGVPPDEVIGFVMNVLATAGLSPQAVAAVVSIDLKSDEAGVLALARTLGVPARFFPAARLEAERDRLQNPSEVVFAETGCHGVAEGAALAAVGAEGELIVPKVKAERVTVAVALSPVDIDAQAVGQARGRLFVIGIGPGAPQWRSPEVDRAVAQATDLVGYGLYLDLLGTAAAGKQRHQSDLGKEIDRARMALDLAAQGKTVALVCSGDAGIYALATLVFELIDHEDRPDWRRIDLSVLPGISALQAAAARAGAPVNHDFCTISLSDLLTPWPTIERRLEAAARGDFVVCFYNPVSQRRRDQLSRARDILLTGRGPDTPVVLARNLGRDGETVEIIRLADLGPDRADMLTMIVVGNSETRRLGLGDKAYVYTPRGYGKILP